MKSSPCLAVASGFAWLFFLQVPAHGQKAALPRVGGGMSYADNWMPTHLETRSKLLDNLEFYARAAAGKADKERGAPVHKIIGGGFKWRMPVDEAIKLLPAGCDHAPEEKIDWDCFPKDSLKVLGFHKDFFEDRGDRFDWLYLIIDRERRLVGVEFVATNPKAISWVPKKPVEKMEPYYDFIKMKNNASTTQHVDYQVVHGEKHAPLIHTALVKNAPPFKVLENVHWYLEPPVARTLVEVVEFQRRMARK